MMTIIPMQKMKCASRAQKLGFAPYLRTLKSTPDRLVRTSLAPNRIKLAGIVAVEC